MAGTQVFWDSNFKVKSLEPALVDFAGVISPIAITTGASVTLQLGDINSQPVKTVVLYRDPAQTAFKGTVEIAKTAIGSPVVAEIGKISFNLNDGPLAISTENITHLIITNSEAATRNLSFLLLKS